jgi:hypothetical protein
MLILATVALWVAETADWIQVSTDDRWSGLTLKGGLIAMAGALLLRVLTPILSSLRRERCTICGHPTERGHTYCLDHLQETVNATRDRARSRSIPRPGAHR